MTLDERFAYLAERQQALAESVELFIHEGREREKRMDARLHQTDAHLDTVIGMVKELVTTVGTLARIVESHEHRITHLEDHE